jgi:hypothetical protein
MTAPPCPSTAARRLPGRLRVSGSSRAILMRRRAGSRSGSQSVATTACPALPAP